MPRNAIEGIRILDFTWYGVGPVSIKYLADNGAEVVKVESNTRPDGLRLGPPWKDATPGINRSQFFASFNTSKKSITLDMSKDKARQIVRQLIPHFDVVAESFTPKTMRNWGLAYEDLRALRPDLIMLSTCMQGQTGPNAQYPGFGNLMASLCGFYYLSGYSEDEIGPPYGAYTDFIAPRFGAFALMGALEHRRKTGQGQHIDLSQYEAALHFLAPAIVDYFATGRVMKPQANHSERYAPHGAYRCRDAADDRWVAIAVESDEQWQAMLQVLGNPAGAERFATMLDRLEHAAELDEFIGGLVRDRVDTELTAELQAAGVAAYPVQNCMDLHADENLDAFDFWHWLDQKEVGPMPYEGLSYRMSRTPGEQFAAPNIGQENNEIFGGLLGMSAAEIEQLEKEQVIF